MRLIPIRVIYTDGRARVINGKWNIIIKMTGELVRSLSLSLARVRNITINKIALVCECAHSDDEAESAVSIRYCVLDGDADRVHLNFARGHFCQRSYACERFVV